MAPRPLGVCLCLQQWPCLHQVSSTCLDSWAGGVSESSQHRPWAQLLPLSSPVFPLKALFHGHTPMLYGIHVEGGTSLCSVKE